VVRACGVRCAVAPSDALPAPARLTATGALLTRSGRPLVRGVGQDRHAWRVIGAGVDTRWRLCGTRRVRTRSTPMRVRGTWGIMEINAPACGGVRIAGGEPSPCCRAVIHATARLRMVLSASAWAHVGDPQAVPALTRWGMRFDVRRSDALRRSAPCVPRHKRWWRRIAVAGRVDRRHIRCTELYDRCARALGALAPPPCPRSSKHWGIGVRMFAVRQRRRW
jgi:hypothetical protein